MGTVHLTNGHHGLFIREKQDDLTQRVVLDADLLARPILDFGHPIGPLYQKMIRSALQSLMNMRGFNAAVSYHVVEKEGIFHLGLPHRQWGEITLGDPSNVVVGFSHDTRRDNHPFRNLFQWLEDAYPGSDNMSDEQYERLVEEWTPEKWLSLFENRVWRRLEVMRTEAEGMRRELDGLAAQISTIEEALR